MNEQSSNRPYGPLPLMIGVTGHRDLRLEDRKRLKELIRDIFQTLKKDFPYTEMILISPLGEGAGRLVAEVAIEEGDLNCTAVGVT